MHKSRQRRTYFFLMAFTLLAWWFTHDLIFVDRTPVPIALDLAFIVYDFWQIATIFREAE